MRRTEIRVMTVDSDRIHTLQERLKQVAARVTPEPEDNGPPQNARRGIDQTLRDPAGAAPAREEPLWALLELVSARDEYIHHELMRLQRTLSRQTFRGAESARRLVRRLARKAEQNAQDLRIRALNPKTQMTRPQESHSEQDAAAPDHKPGRDHGSA